MKQNNDVKIIGITGGTGAGKSILSAEFKRLGAEVIDADEISRRITKKDGCAFSEVVSCFGRQILDENGEIDRNKLGSIVFADPEKLALLEKITHKHIFSEIEERINSCKDKVAVLDVPLLFQCDFPIKCDLTVAVIADNDIRIKRIVERDAISRDEASARMKNQLSNDEYKTLADVWFENDGDLDKLHDFANKIYKEL